MLPDPSVFDDAARLLEESGSAADHHAGQARTAADELRAAAVLLRRLADAVQQLGTDMAAAGGAGRLRAPRSRAAALLETVLSSTGTAARAALSYQDGAAQAVRAADAIDGLGTGFSSGVTCTRGVPELDGAFPVTLDDMARDGGGVLSAVSAGRGVALVERESEEPDSLDGSGRAAGPTAASGCGRSPGQREERRPGECQVHGTSFARV